MSDKGAAQARRQLAFERLRAKSLVRRWLSPLIPAAVAQWMRRTAFTYAKTRLLFYLELSMPLIFFAPLRAYSQVEHPGLPKLIDLVINHSPSPGDAAGALPVAIGLLTFYGVAAFAHTYLRLEEVVRGAQLIPPKLKRKIIHSSAVLFADILASCLALAPPTVILILFPDASTWPDARPKIMLAAAALVIGCTLALIVRSLRDRFMLRKKLRPRLIHSLIRSAILLIKLGTLGLIAFTVITALSPNNIATIIAALITLEIAAYAKRLTRLNYFQKAAQALPDAD